MDGDDVVPLLLGHVVDHPVTQDAGCGDHDVDAAKGVERRLDDALAALPGGDRLDDRRCLSTKRFDGGDGLVCRSAGLGGAVECDSGIVDDHLCAVAGQLLGDGTADAASGACDDGDFSLQ